MEEIRSVSDLPVKYVFNTHHHPDHVGNNQKFIDAGAQVIAVDGAEGAHGQRSANQGYQGPPERYLRQGLRPEVRRRRRCRRIPTDAGTPATTPWSTFPI